MILSNPIVTNNIGIITLKLYLYKDKITHNYLNAIMNQVC